MTEPQSPQTPPDDPMIGRVLKQRYRLERALGRGGFGVAYLAIDEDEAFTRATSGPRRVVVKMPLPERLAASGGAIPKDFSREASRLTGLQHAHILKVIDLGFDGATPFLVLEYATGGSLADRLDAAAGGMQSPEEVLAWLPDVAKALDYVAGKDVLHRDVKPSNILFDEGGSALLADFGIAKVFGGTSETTGSLPGSPLYMAPDAMLLDEAKGLDGRYDQYALAVTVYEALSGRFPYEPKTWGDGVRRSMGEQAAQALLYRKTRDEPTPIVAFAGHLGERTWSPLARALSRDRDERYPSCVAFAEALRNAVLAAERPARATVAAVSPPPPGPLPERELATPDPSGGVSSPVWRRWAILGAIALAVGIGGVQQLGRETPGRRTPEVPLSVAREPGPRSPSELRESPAPPVPTAPSAKPVTSPMGPPSTPSTHPPPSNPGMESERSRPAEPSAETWGWERNAALDASPDPARPAGTPGRYRNLLVLDPDPEVPADARFGGALSTTYFGEPRTFNFLTANDSTLADQVETYVADRPVKPHGADPSKYGPALAWRVEASPDFREFTLFFRRDVVWHPPMVDVARHPHLAGAHPMLARDYKFTLDLIRDPHSDCAPLREEYESLGSVEVIDDWTCVVRWSKTRWRALAATLERGPIPEFVYAYAEDGRRFPAETLGTAFNDHWYAKVGVCGCGPYRMTSYETGVAITLERFDGWYGTRYPIERKRLVIDVDPEGLRDRIERGELDFASLPLSAFRKAFLDNADPKSPFKDGRIVEHRIDRPSYLYLGWKNTNPLFRDARVRRALALACNREDICKTDFLGRYKPMAAPIFPGSPQADPSLEPPPFDPKQAKRLFDEAGWRLNAESGVREMVIDGKVRPLSFSLSWPGTPSDLGAALARVKREFAQVGVAVELKQLEWSQWSAAISAGNFEAIAGGFSVEGWDHEFDQLWNSRSIGAPNSSNYFGYSNPELDRLSDSLEGETDFGRRVKTVRRIGRILYDEQPCCFLGWQVGLGAVRSRVQNVTGHVYKARPFFRTFPMWVTDAGDATPDRGAPVSVKASEVSSFLAGWAESAGTELDAATGYPKKIRRLKDDAEMVLIPAGTFQMGAVPTDKDAQDDEMPRHAVTLSKAYYLDVNEVTVGQWKKFVAGGGGRMPTDLRSEATDRHPIHNADHTEATAFATWAGVALPTEAQWERAAKGGHDDFVYPWGTTDDVKNRNGEVSADGFGGLAPVRSYDPNDFGLYDMSGNVLEWCSDWYGGSYYAASPSRDPSGPGSGSARAVRGGSWSSGDVSLRASYRYYDAPSLRNVGLGFRLARSL